MSKALQGAAALGGAVALGTAAFFNPALVATPWFGKLMAGLVLSGISSEFGALADAISANRGQNIMIRQPASNREIIRGEWRTGGTLIYPSTTGGTHRQYNRVIVLATTECDSITGLYLDGRKVYWNVGSGGNSTRNGVNFGGDADSEDHRGPDGSMYNFGGLVYCEARYGDQLPGDVITGLTANDPTWAPSADGSPYAGGCTYVYLKIRKDDNQFPGEPEIRFTVRGKNDIYDPRTGTRGWTNNPALLMADLLTDAKWGYGYDYETEIEEDQLIAAANICDEMVPLANGGSERRYTFNWKHDTSTAPGDVMTQMLACCAGRYSWVGGQWHIFPASWLGPTFSFTEADLVSLNWKSYRPVDKKFNRVVGTYTAPNYPYNVAGNLYDSNGWADGSMENTFPFGWQPTSYPMYACDVLHGYPLDQYLAEDSGVKGAWDAGVTYAKGYVVSHDGGIWRSKVAGNLGHEPSAFSEQWVAYANYLVKEIGCPSIISVTQSQRVAKIHLKRNRYQGTGDAGWMMRAFALAPLSVLKLSFGKMGWTEKVLEVLGTTFSVQRGGGSDGDAPKLSFGTEICETGPDVYEWSTAEELTPYNVPALPDASSFTPAVPRNMALTSGVATAVVSPTGEVIPRIKVSWDVPLDGLSQTIQIRYRPTGGDWIDAPTADVSSLYAFVSGVVAGGVYDVQIRSVRTSGAKSAWVEIDGYTVSLTLSTLTVLAMAQGSLVGEAFPDGTAGIEVIPFTLPVGGYSASYTPSPSEIRGLTQGQLWYVYIVDTLFAGGEVAPVATQNPEDFLNKQGYILLGSLKTPSLAGSGSGTRYYPSTYADVGTRSSVNPAAAFDGDVTTSCVVSGTMRMD